MHRRTALGSIASVIAGTVGYAALTQDAEATTLNVDGFDVEISTKTPA